MLQAFRMQLRQILDGLHELYVERRPMPTTGV